MTTVPLAPPRRLLEFTLDDEAVRVPEGATILDVCRQAGTDVPTLRCGLQSDPARAGQ